MSSPLAVRRFIPFTKSDLIKMVLNSLDWQPEEQKQVSQLAGLLSDLLHFEFHYELETLKNIYVTLNPDRDTLCPLAVDNDKKNEQLFAERLERILVSANYDQISEAEIVEALATESLVKLQLDVDFADFEKIIFYGRGERQRELVLKYWFGLRRELVRFTRYDRIIIFFQIKDKDYFSHKDVPPGLVPGATMLKLFRNVPKADLEMLFPNTEVKMRLADKLLIGIPAVISGGALFATKLGGTLILIAALVSFWLGFRDQPVVLDQTALVALGAGMAALGGFLWRQFSKFRNRKIQFMKTLTDNLYFRNLDNNAGVFYRLIDDAEEEEFKEAFLAYTLLFHHTQRQANTPDVDRDELDHLIEYWFDTGWKANVDFEVDDALRKLKKWGLVVENQNRLKPVSLAEALEVLNEHWRSRQLSEQSRNLFRIAQ